MPLTDRSQAKEGGWAQVREALVSFEGDVKGAEFDQWGGQLFDEEGKKRPPKEFLEIQCDNVEVLEVTEELTMNITDMNFRVNCSDFKGSFWIDEFLASADEHKIIVPQGLIGKRLVFKKKTLVAKNKDGSDNPKYNSTNYVIVGVKGSKSAVQPTTQPTPEVPSEPATPPGDPMVVAANIAVGKTEAQFKTAIALEPSFVGSPLLSLAKTGMLTQALVSEGRLVLGEDGKYQKA